MTDSNKREASPAQEARDSGAQSLGPAARPEVDIVRHLSADNWERAQAWLVAKAIRELCHERLLRVRRLEDGEGVYELDTPGGDRYRFRARSYGLHHLEIDARSLVLHRNGEAVPLDVTRFVKSVRELLPIVEQELPGYFEELVATVASTTYRFAQRAPTSRQLVDASFQEIEAAMYEGHPGFIANHGRIGFSALDHARYAGGEALPYDVLLGEELEEKQRLAFEAKLRAADLEPADYIFFPVHPWQWFNKISITLAADIACARLVCLGYGEDRYVAQQSIRTMYNQDRPERRYVKSALTILNMGFMRGLPHYYLGSAPAVAAWLERLLYADPYLEERGFRMLSEVASVSFTNEPFEEWGPHNDYNKLIASLWRESPASVLRPSERAMTMAALLHRDRNGAPLVGELVRASKLTVEEWVGRYLRAYFEPILHCFYRYGIVFMPHGENVILALEEHAVTRIFMKDITEEVATLDPDLPLPDGLERLFVEVPDEKQLLSVFIDVFDGFFRHLVPLLDESLGLSERRFWRAVKTCATEYQAAFPALEPRFERYDLFVEEFEFSCLNRLQLRNRRQMVDLDEPVERLQFAGTLINPLARVEEMES
ncbi:MAG: IucA/IucC family protein [Myxococcota bacterium]